jgi:hypothetical protein
MPDRLDSAERFLAVMQRQAGWVNSGDLSRCDRCGSREPSPMYVRLGELVLLILCPSCMSLTASLLFDGHGTPEWRTWATAMDAAEMGSSPVQAPQGRA